MAPITEASATSSPLQIILGIALPFLLVASAIPAIMLKRHLEYKAAMRPQRDTRTTTPRRLRTSRLPLKSVYLTRVDYYLPPTNTTTSFTTSIDRSTSASFVSSQIGSTPSVPLLPSIPTSFSHMQSVDPSYLQLSNVGSLVSDVSAVASAIPSSVGLGLPSLGSLPSLNADLCEFTAYADAINSEPSSLRPVYRSSTSLLHLAFSTTDFDALSIDSFSQIIQLAKKTQHPSGQLRTATLIPVLPTVQTLGHESQTIIENTSDETLSERGSIVYPASDLGSVECVNGAITGSLAAAFHDCSQILDDISGTRLAYEDSVISSIDYGVSGTHEEDDDFAENDDTMIEVDTSNLNPSTTVWSLPLDSSSTLASVMAVRLSEFPPVPEIFAHMLNRKTSVQPQTDVNVFPTKRSEDSDVTRSLSLPASLNLLEVRLDDIFWDKRYHGPVLYPFPDTSGAGELWDEDDDNQFAVCVRQMATDSPKATRYTWTAGMPVPHRSEAGDLWDEDDERRVSCVGQFSEFKVVSFTSLTGFGSTESGLGSTASGLASEFSSDVLNGTSDLNLATYATIKHPLAPLFDAKNAGKGEGESKCLFLTSEGNQSVTDLAPIGESTYLVTGSFEAKEGERTHPFVGLDGGLGSLDPVSADFIARLGICVS